MLILLLILHPNTITWQQFRDAFRAHHIADGLLKLKQREFLALKYGNMSVNEYLDKFTLTQKDSNAFWMD
jgi:hypothetical protein